MGLGSFLDFNHLTEGYGPAHGFPIVTLIHQALLGQGFPATDDLGSVVHLELIILVFPQRLQTAIHMGFFHRQHDHLVIYQEAPLYRFGEGDDEQFLSVQGFIIHGTEGYILRLGFTLGYFPINTRGGSHVDTFGPFYVLPVMNFDESAFILLIKNGPCSAVGFIANDQVKIRKAMLLLRPVYDLNGVISAEDHRHPLVIPSFMNGLSQISRTGGGGVTKFMEQGFNLIFLQILPLCLTHITV
ncbi:hypothetical protein FEMY_19980 [Ferrovum myxofaciens]|uniref:Uncharacterized protein n=1 Tax=Ferrovum myxofaciens TaxID=416213 RepID=A0A149VW50_9PROT|nr:hypothetical protein FEMY_19980 [Ferrovum myxofaciens]